MKRNLFIFFVLITYNSFSQISTINNFRISTIDVKYLIGIWQADTTLDGAAWLDSYQFYSNNNFVFNFNEYNSNKRILRLSGTYKLVNDTILFVVKKIYVLEGGVLERGSPAWENEWLFDNPQIKEVKIERKFYAPIKKLKNNSNYPCVLIEFRKYFKLNNDPNDY
jgi:hypothetical protein